MDPTFLWFVLLLSLYSTNVFFHERYLHTGNFLSLHYVAFILWVTQALALSQVSPSQPSEVVVSAKGSLPSASGMSDATTASISTEDIPLYAQRILNISYITGSSMKMSSQALLLLIRDGWFKRKNLICPEDQSH